MLIPRTCSVTRRALCPRRLLADFAAFGSEAAVKPIPISKCMNHRYIKVHIIPTCSIQDTHKITITF